MNIDDLDLTIEGILVHKDYFKLLTLPKNHDECKRFLWENFKKLVAEAIKEIESDNWERHIF